jgi:hypothetical protein
MEAEMERESTIEIGNGRHRPGPVRRSFQDPGSALGRGKQVAEAVLDKGRQQIKRDLTARKDHAAGRLETISEAIGSAAVHLRESGEGALGEFTDSAARYLRRMSETLAERTVDDLFAEASDFAKNNAAVYIGGGILLGALIARFMQNNGFAGSRKA